MARALRPRNFLAEEKRSLLLLLDWDVEYSAVSVGAAGGTAAAAAVVTVVDFAIIIEYRVSREPCNNILQPTLKLGSERPLRQVDSLVTSPQRTCKH